MTADEKEEPVDAGFSIGTDVLKICLIIKKMKQENQPNKKWGNKRGKP